MTHLGNRARDHVTTDAAASGRWRRRVAAATVASLVGTVTAVSVPGTIPVAQAATITITVNASNVDEDGASPTDCTLTPTCTLLAAFAAAEAAFAAGDDVIIEFAPSLHGVTFQPGTGLNTANPALYYTAVPAGRTLEINGPAAPAAPPIFDALDSNRIFDIAGSGTVVMRDLDLRNGRAEGIVGSNGGAIRTTAALTLERVTISGSSAEQRGGAVHATDDLTLVDADLSANGAPAGGGAIHITGAASDLVLDGASLTSNFNGIGGGQGGAVECLCATVQVIGGTTFDGNNGRAGGGALAATGAAVTVVDGAFTANVAFNGPGGAILALTGSTVDVVGGTFTNNTHTASNSGGAIGCICAGVTVEQSSFTDNGAFIGGAISVDSAAGTLSVSDTVFTNNDAGLNGGAIDCSCASADVIRSSIVGSGSSLQGGAINIVTATGTLRLTDTVITSASSSTGGGIACQCVGVALDRTLVTLSSATTGGGALYSSGDVVVTSSRFSDNVAGSGGAILVDSGADIEIARTSMAGNSAVGVAPAGVGAGFACDRCDSILLREVNLQDNVAAHRGGGAWVEASGLLTILNATFAGGAAAVDGEALSIVDDPSPGTLLATLDHVTVANHRDEGAVVPALAVSGASIVIEDSILAGNEDNCTGFTFDGNGAPNVVVGAGSCVGSNTTIVNADPGLRPIDFVGGPNRAYDVPIPVYAITGTSVASNLSACAPGEVDARGMPRGTPVCDAGAFEADLTVVADNTSAVDSSGGVVAVDAVPAAALTPPSGNGSADSGILIGGQLRGTDLRGTPLRNIPLRNIGLDPSVLGDDLLEAVSLAQVPTTYPGGWTAYLTAIGAADLAAQPANLVSLAELFAVVAALPAGTPDELVLTLGDVDLSGTVLGDLSLGALGLAGETLADLAGTSGFDWCLYIDCATPGDPTPAPGEIDPTQATLVALALEGIPLRNIPLRNIPLRNIDLTDAPLRNIPLRNIDLSVSPLRNIPLRNISAAVEAAEAAAAGPTGLEPIALLDAPLRNIPLRNIDLSASPLRNIPLRNIALADSPLRNIPLRNIPLRNIDVDASPLRNIPLRNIPLRNIDVDASPLRNIPLRNIDLSASPLRNIPLRNIPLRNIDVDASPLRNIPLRNIDLSASPLRNIPLRNITTIAQLIDCGVYDCTSATATLVGATLLPGATLGLIADGLPAGTDLGVLGDIEFEVGDAFVLADVAAAFDADGGAVFTLADLIALFAAAGGEIYTLADIAAAFQADGGELFTLADVAQAFQAVGGDVFTLGDLFAVFLADVDGTYTLADLSAAIAAGAAGDASVFALLWDALTVEYLDELIALTGAAEQDFAGIQFGQLLELLAQLEPPVTLADLFLGLFGDASEDMPWEDVDLDSAATELKAAAFPGGVPFGVRVGSTLPFGSYDLTVTLPEGFGYVPGSLVVPAGVVAATAEPTIEQQPDGSAVARWRLRIAEQAPGDTVRIQISALPPLSVGPSAQIEAEITSLDYSIGATTTDGYVVVDALESNDTPSTATALGRPDDKLVISHLSPGDVDWFSFDVDQGEDVSLILSNLPADYDLLVFAPDTELPLRREAVDVKQPAPDGGLSLLGDSAPAPSIGPDVDTSAPAGFGLLRGSARRELGDEQVDTGPLPAGTYLVKVSGYNDAGSARPYVLRTRVTGEVSGRVCAAVTPAGPALALPGSVTAVGPDTDTLILVDTARMARSYPATTTVGGGTVADVVAALATFTTTLANATTDRFGGTRAAVVDLAAVPAVRAANAVLDANPCDPQRSNAVVRAIGAHLDAVVTPSIEHVVIVGADDQIPMARVRDDTPAHNEREFAAEAWRSSNPVAASQALGYVLTDDAYADANPTSVGVRELFQPELAIGRLVETPADVVRALQNFVTFDGQLDPATAASTGYDFLEDGARAVAGELDAVVPASAIDQTLISTGPTAWGKADLVAAVANAGPDIASVNAHFDYSRAVPAREDAKDFPSEYFATADVRGPAGNPLEGSIVFSMGCHSGLSVSDVAVGSTANSDDWAETFLGEGAAMFAGNTGYGYGDTVTVAYTEELMRLFAKRLGTAASIGDAMAAAKRSYIGAIQELSPFEMKATSQIVFYGLPMYRIAGAEPPVYEPFEPVTPDPVSGQPSALVTFDTAPTPQTPASPFGTVYTVDGEVSTAPYQPIQPQATLDVTAAGTEARGALITALVSDDVDTLVDPAVSSPTDDVVTTNVEPSSQGIVFPAALQSVGRIDDGQERDVLVLVPGQFRGLPGDPEGRGVQRLFPTIEARVFYAPPGNTDTTPARITATRAVIVDGQAVVEVEVADTDVSRVLVMYREAGGPPVPTTWKQLELGSSDGARWIGTAPAAAGATELDYFVQVLDTGGNVSVSSDKGANFSALPAPVVEPTPGSPLLEVTPATPETGPVFTGPVTVQAVPSVPGQQVELIVNGIAGPNPTTLASAGVYTVTAVAPGVDPAERTIVINTAPPTATATVAPPANALGWHTTTPVTVSITADAGALPVASVSYRVDGGSPVVVPGASASVPITDEGEHTVTYTAADVNGRAGNEGAVVVRIDTVAPVVTCAATPTFVLGQPGAVVTATVTGATTNGTVTMPVTTTAVGSFTASAPAAVDQAGNATPVSCGYRVVYTKAGFVEPVTMSATWNEATAGRTIPLKWRLSDAAGVGVADSASFVRVVFTPIACSAGTADTIESYTTATSTLQYLGNGNWQFNWKTAKQLAGTCQLLTLELRDGTTISARFRFR